MNTDVKISDLGIQINFEAFRKFNLKAIGQDGVIFFQYFAHHCRNVSVWTHSDRQLEQELGIKRTILEKLRKQFSELGILSITKSPNDNNVRAYRMNYDALTKAEVLRTIYRLDEPDSYALKLLQQGFKECARKQPKQMSKNKTNRIYSNEMKEKHIVIAPPNIMKCLHCGYTHPIGVPVSIPILTATSKVFIRKHKNCKPQ